MEKLPEAKVRSGGKAELHVERENIRFYDVPGGRVRIQVTVRNAGAQRSLPISVRLESAPLGAFLPWRPLTRLLVPALEPGESREISTEISRPRTAALGSFDRVPPKRLLTAVNSPEQPPPRPAAGLSGLLDRLRKRRSVSSTGEKVPGRGSLASDIWDLCGRPQSHWAGNINIFVGSRPVERHLANALRIYPGRPNFALFFVGDPRSPDAYAFELIGLKPDWNAKLYDMTRSETLLASASDVPVEENQWVESELGVVALLAIHPPADCGKGNLGVHVTRRSCGRTAIVEFDLDPSAQGPGCYSL